MSSRVMEMLIILNISVLSIGGKKDLQIEQNFNVICQSVVNSNV
jgi:hypothetical protein